MPRCSSASIPRLTLFFSSPLLPPILSLSLSVSFSIKHTVLVALTRDKKNGATLCKNRYDGSLFHEILRYRTVISSGLIIRRQAGFH